MRLKKTAMLAATPITVDDLKTHSVISHTADDGLLAELIADAIEQVEADTGRALVETTWTLSAARFPAVIRLPKPPLIAVDSIVYTDPDGAQQALAESEYQVATSDIGAIISPAPGKCWPAVECGNNTAVVITVRSGYIRDDGAGGMEGELPRRARRAVLIWAAHLYENREHMAPIQLNELPSYRAALSGLEVDLL